MIDERQKLEIGDFFSSQREHKIFKVEAFGARDQIFFECILTSVMGVDRLFIKAVEQNGSVYSFDCFQDEDFTPAIDWIEEMSDTYFNSAPYSVVCGREVK